MTMYCFMILYSSLLLLLSGQYINADDCPPAGDIKPCSCIGKKDNMHAHCTGISSLDQLIKSVKGFRGCKLLTFSLEQSKFDYLPSNVFENVTIEHVSISKTEISRIANIGEPQFKGLETSLKSLTISETFTESRPFAYVQMDHLKNLQRLEVRKNHVGIIHNEWFKNGPTSLEIVRFVQGEIQRVGFRALQTLKNLKIVDLSDNSISYITRTSLPQPAPLLEEINLERNQLTNLEDDFFSDMPSLKTVGLELNEITTIGEKTWGSVWNHLVYVNIHYNPMVCDTKIKWIYERKGKNLEDKLVGMCYQPFRLMERDLYTLKISDFK